MSTISGSPRASESKSERAYRVLRKRIDAGQYAPGFRLGLASLARELGMSVVPVREAIRRLEAESLVTFERNVGAQVALLRETEYLHTMQTLALVEGSATALASPNISPAQMTRAREINENMRDTLNNFEPKQFTALNLEFHSVLFESCPNPHILDLVHRGWNRMSLLRESSFSFVPDRAQESITEHERILQLIEAPAPGIDIELAARNHRLATLEAVLAHQNKHALPAPAA
ncbi:GntR family transcriptional regulator [Lysinibacter sp. HNR]|uniref:GntR family transcriptional regulator n=1 Tax=Lysinibacter sp. HNR TaxID=3031408 RepID=UPI002435D635|nr:GntR family transcriptional regulator [Lysinibacter sp. HNR]WGD37447.1 GntR family transcriptional regulator [Lysinibacter sp. HNR]